MNKITLFSILAGVSTLKFNITETCKGGIFNNWFYKFCIDNTCNRCDIFWSSSCSIDGWTFEKEKDTGDVWIKGENHRPFYIEFSDLCHSDSVTKTQEDSKHLYVYETQYDKLSDKAMEKIIERNKSDRKKEKYTLSL